MKLLALKEYIKLIQSENKDEKQNKTLTIEDIHKLLINYKDLENFEQIKILNFIKLCYYNRKYIHNKLFDSEEIIRLNHYNEKEENSLVYFFYLTLLIRDNDAIINYSYSIEYIKKINSTFKSDNNDEYYNIIGCKIIDELINNYKGLDEYLYNKEGIETIEKENNQRIDDNINALSEFNIRYEDFKDKKIDEIYSNIIISLIKNNMFEDYEYTYNIIKTIDLESIDITNKIYEDISDLLNNDESIKIKYNIIKLVDLYDNKKVNFYFILLKYILKDNSLLIDKIEYLYKMKISITNLINSNSASFSSNIEGMGKNLKERLKYIKENMYTSDSKSDENEIKNDNEKLDNIKLPTNSETKYVSSNNISHNPDSSINLLNYHNLNNSNLSSNLQNHPNNDILNLGFISDVKSLPKEPLTDNQNNKKYKYVIFNSKKFIRKFEETIEKKGNGEGELKIKNTADFIIQIKDFYICGGTNNELFVFDRNNDYKTTIYENDWIYNIIEFQNDEDKTSFLGCTKNKIILHEIAKDFTVTKSNDKILEKESPHYLIKITNSIDNKFSNSYLICTQDKVFFIDNIFNKIIQIRENDLYLHKFVKSGLKVYDKIVIFKSNKILSKGEDNLIIFNYTSKKEVKTNLKRNYSFILSPNGLSLMHENEEKSQKKVLLCACKKYCKKQKNGILAINIKNDPNNYKSFFYNTKNYEVYCFCPLIKNLEQKVLTNETKITDTDYFLVGGFDLKKNKSIIKLFKVNYGKDNILNNIEFLENVSFENKEKKEEELRLPISCMIQSNIEQKIIITCWDGKIYSLSKPNIDKYLQYDKENEETKFL